MVVSYVVNELCLIADNMISCCSQATGLSRI